VKLTFHPHLAPELRTYKSLPALPDILSLCGVWAQEQHYRSNYTATTWTGGRVKGKIVKGYVKNSRCN